MSKKKSELDDLTLDSKNIFNNVLKTYSVGSHAGLKTAIRSIIRQTNIYDFKKLTYSHYLNLKETPMPPAKSKLITTFFKYLYCYDIIENQVGFEKCYWNKEELRIETEKKLEIKKPKKANNTILPNDSYVPSLTIEQLEKLMLFEQNSIYSDDINFKNQRLAFCFYLLFYENIQITTIRNDLNAKNFENGILFSPEKNINVPEAYWNMLNYYKNRPYSGFTQLDEYVRQLGNIIGIKDLIPNSIAKKREQSMFPCPECGKTTLSFAKNWKSINGILVCNDCAERIILSGQKKKYN